MAALLLRWLNHELKLSTHVSDLETDFASGYLLGELLHRLNQLHNLSDFVRTSSADAKVVNFCLLEPTLCQLNVKFDANVATAIMNKKKDAAANLLYQIKMAAARVGRAPGISTKSLDRTGVIPLHNRPEKLAKAAFDSHRAQMFKQTIRRRVQSSTALQREEDHIAEDKMKQGVYLAKLAEQKEILEATMTERRHQAYIHSSYIKQALEETDTPAWRRALQEKNAREQRQAAFFQRVMNKRQEAEERLAGSLRRKVCRDLDDFDAHEESKATTTDRSRTSTGYGLRSLTTALNTASEKEKYQTLNLVGPSTNERESYEGNLVEMQSASDVIKQQKQQRERRKEKLSRRRQRFVQECTYTYTRRQTTREMSILENLRLRDTNCENNLEGERNRILAYKDVARENRLLRNQEYAKQQEMDSVAALDRDTSCYHNLLLQLEDNIEMQFMQQSDVRASINAANRFDSEQISSSIMNDLVKFVLFIAEKREETFCIRDQATFITLETWNEYKTQFANGFNFDEWIPWSTTEELSQAALLDSHELEQYLARFQRSPTSLNQPPLLFTSNDDSLFPGATEVLKDCFVLGEEVKALRWLARSSLDSETSTILETLTHKGYTDGSSSLIPDHIMVRPQQQLRILVFGPPFAGKETQAKLLSESHNLVAISVHELIQNAVQSLTEVGIQVNDFLTSGKELPPELYGRLVTEAIKTIEAQDPTQSNKAGWVIYDLPATERHGQTLDKYLRGTVDPVATSSPYDFESAIAPGRSKPPLSPTFFHGKSDIDLVFHINCPTRTVVDRCLGRVADRATGVQHHLVFDPPPNDSTVRHRLHHVNPSAYSRELLSLHCWANDEFVHGHKAYHSKFDTFHEFSCSGMTVSEMHEAIVGVVDQLLKERQEKAEMKQLEQEVNEQSLMSTEEERQRRLNTFNSEIDEANVAVANIEALIAEAEEAKAKKEEMVDLRQKLDEARRHLAGTMGAFRYWMTEEKVFRPEGSVESSGELAPATAQVLAAVWNDMEMEYIATMKKSFAMLRKQRHRVTDRVQKMTSKLCEFVRRPDQKQDLVTEFQRLFNEVLDEMRFDDPTKLELHARTDMLQDDLMSVVEAKGTENTKELDSMMTDEWIEDMCQQVAVIYQMALQAECDRYRTSIQILIDGHYAASTDRSQLNSVVELWQMYRPRLELTCRLYRDCAAQNSVESLSAPVPAGKPSLKGKAKVATPTVVPPTNVTAAIDNIPAGSLTMSELLTEFTHVLQQCTSWIEAIAPMANAAASKDVEGQEAHLQLDGDFCRMNLVNGLKYEYNVMEQRVHFLREATDSSCAEITRSMRSVELTLRDVLKTQTKQEEVAVAALIEYVRAAIEREVALPSYIDISPEILERFPITKQLRQDTIVRIDGSKRLLPRPLPVPPPSIEEFHDLLLNVRQRDSLEEALISQTCHDSGLLPLIVVVEIIAGLTSLPDALPNAWRQCPPHVIAEIVARFTVQQSAFVDVKALTAAMSSCDDLLCQFLQNASQEERQLQEKTEGTLFLQPETTTKEPSLDEL